MLITHEQIINNNQNKTISVATVREHYHCKLFIILLLSAAVKLNLFSLL